MALTQSTTRDHYWYTDEAAQARSVDVLQAMRSYRAAEAAMRRRTRESMGMGENDLLALRFLIRNAGKNVPVAPKDLAKYLGISTASTTVLLDRLEKSGHIIRRPSTTDRRALIIEATPHTDDEVRSTLGTMHDRMMSVASTLEPDEARVIVSFFEKMHDAVDQIDRVEASQHAV